ncbi:centromere protein S [Striga asiatica]|uniref:Centromere protein S n=1 Tax=Striga asiatica TaxID=4170 RepID=A0A5A7QJN6_STRAF|nr:centromere protein S [Striga asiatica]
MASDVERVEEADEEEEEESATELLRDRFRLCTISIAEAEAKQNGMEVSQPIMACISDLAFKYAQQLAKDLELFAQHAGRKSVNMEDVILSGKIPFMIVVWVGESIALKYKTILKGSSATHRNNHLSGLLRSFSNNIKAKEPQSERKRKKTAKREDKAVTDVLHIAD